MTTPSRWHRWVCPIVLLALLIAMTAVRADEETGAVTSATWRRLDKAARGLAKKGRGPETSALIEQMRLLGRGTEDLDAIQKKTKRDLLRARRRAPDVPTVVKELRRAATELAKTLPELEGDAAAHRASVILALDGSNTVAHETLGHVQHGGVWMDAAMPALLERRGAIAEAARAIRRLDFDVVHSESDLPIFQELYGRKGNAVTWRNLVSVHSAKFTPAKMERMLKGGLRAIGLTRYIMTGTLDANVTESRLTMAALGSRADYERSIDLALQQGSLTPDKERIARLSSAFRDRRGFTVTQRVAEALVIEGIHYNLFDVGQPCLHLGHMNWICLSFIGVSFPGVLGIDVKERMAESRTTTEKARREREEMLILSEAGMAGARAYIRYLAARREDPPWSASMQDQIAKIKGDSVLKTTSVVEYLQERGEFARVWEETRRGSSETPASRIALFERVLGQPLSAFEDDWRRWLLPRTDGMAERLDGGRAVVSVPPGAIRAIARLRGIRAQAFRKGYARLCPPVKYDPDLSVGCRAHALYLDNHPEQKSAWPDAHEEYADKEDFSAAGSVAGLSSVIAPGVSTPEKAMDGWLGTFYHRLPLLDPGLLRVGWGMEKGIAVLDASSMVRPAPARMDVVWPPRESKDVSPFFNPELPNPVPGEDQSAWGTCVTLQVFYDEEMEAEIEMHLYVGESVNPAREVACHFSSPSRPTNPELAPRGAYALMPKAHLMPKTRYTVLVKGLTHQPEKVWSFTTGTR